MWNYHIFSVCHGLIFPTVQHPQINEKNRLLFGLDSMLDATHTPPMLYHDYTVLVESWREIGSPSLVARFGRGSVIRAFGSSWPQAHNMLLVNVQSYKSDFFFN